MIKILLYTFFSLFTLYSADTIHILQPGETMYALSRKYSIPLAALLDYNTIETPAKVTAGQAISIPEMYTVQKGDTLYSIARKFSLSVSQLQSVNKKLGSTMLPVGKQLIIPDIRHILPAEAPAEKPENANAVSPPPTDLMDWRDPRLYVKKALDKNIEWPVPADDISYLAGKLYGVVIDTRPGAAVKAITSGKIIFQGPHRGYGYVVFIQTNTKYLYVYAGLSATTHRINDEVTAGEFIGTLAADTFSGTPRLYFMVYHNNEPVDPATAPRNL